MHAPLRRRRTSRAPWRPLAALLCVALAMICRPAWAFRPFEGTDAAVADFGERYRLPAFGECGKGSLCRGEWNMRKLTKHHAGL